jgi:hypothetical protein
MFAFSYGIPGTCPTFSLALPGLGRYSPLFLILKAMISTMWLQPDPQTVESGGYTEKRNGVRLHNRKRAAAQKE